METVRRWWRSRSRFGLSAVMLLVLACGLGWYLNSVRVQRDAARAIEQAGGKVFHG